MEKGKDFILGTFPGFLIASCVEGTMDLCGRVPLSYVLAAPSSRDFIHWSVAFDVAPG